MFGRETSEPEAPDVEMEVLKGEVLDPEYPLWRLVGPRAAAAQGQAPGRGLTSAAAFSTGTHRKAPVRGTCSTV